LLLETEIPIFSAMHIYICDLNIKESLHKNR
jgi:hypothetical protein